MKIFCLFKGLAPSDKKTVYILAAIFGMYALIDIISIARMGFYIARGQSSHQVTFSGVFHAEEISVKRGYRIVLSGDQGRRIYSCEEPGISTFASCLARKSEWEGRQASITSVPFISGILFGQVERPLQIFIVGSGVVYFKEFDNMTVIRLILERCFFILITISIFGLVAGFTIKMLNYYPRRKM